MCYLRSLLSHVDVIGLNHFRAFMAAWNVPAGALTAESGIGRPDPSAELFKTDQRELGGRACHGSATGLAEPRQRRQHERSRACRRALALALHPGYAQRSGVRMGARLNKILEPFWSDGHSK
jgi:hypothetical protein